MDSIFLYARGYDLKFGRCRAAMMAYDHDHIFVEKLKPKMNDSQLLQNVDPIFEQLWGRQSAWHVHPWLNRPTAHDHSCAQPFPMAFHGPNWGPKVWGFHGPRRKCPGLIQTHLSRNPKASAKELFFAPCERDVWWRMMTYGQCGE